LDSWACFLLDNSKLLQLSHELLRSLSLSHFWGHQGLLHLEASLCPGVHLHVSAASLGSLNARAWSRSHLVSWISLL
jgi:hypothetical protein